LLNHRERASAVYNRTGVESLAKLVVVDHGEWDMMLNVKNIALNQGSILNRGRTGKVEIRWRTGEAINK
jgi:hypothetical protein